MCFFQLLPDDDVTPESLVAALTAGESSSADKAQVEQVLPWMKFLWEVYRTVLEILRNNAKLESVYQGTAQRALRYCLKYSRNSEFKRLCDILRSHLANLNKYGQNANISLTNPEVTKPFCLSGSVSPAFKCCLSSSVFFCHSFLSLCLIVLLSRCIVAFQLCHFGPVHSAHVLGNLPYCPRKYFLWFQWLFG